ncbi:radC protein [Lactobacillus selangorensis]|uniref:RadC protein n=1 Tax=Lactobacillus selangorensis TaxID=81857 RepID=A0A0R2G1H5_9LACO|nr:DNA repair protein RadC [Lactobacillus selangorensis]KRN29345.1 radC protein [Lactobacillus selangorensis]KRN34126.1 radC protein [Lactobacillus selangorensis]
MKNEKSTAREELTAHGAAALENADLLTVILGSGTKQVPVTQVAANLLRHFPELRGLSQAAPAELAAVDGIGPVKAQQLAAVCELGRRTQAAQQWRYGLAVSSQLVGEQMAATLANQSQEMLIGLYLDTKNQIIKQQLLYQGTLNCSVAHPREIFHYAVQYSAARFILVHNHPSGIATPSAHDLQFSQRVSECGQLMGIELLDHIIVGRENYVSLRSESLLKTPNALKNV